MTCTREDGPDENIGARARVAIADSRDPSDMGRVTQAKDPRPLRKDAGEMVPLLAMTRAPVVVTAPSKTFWIGSLRRSSAATEPLRCHPSPRRGERSKRARCQDTFRKAAGLEIALLKSYRNPTSRPRRPGGHCGVESASALFRDSTPHSDEWSYEIDGASGAPSQILEKTGRPARVEPGLVI